MGRKKPPGWRRKTARKLPMEDGIVKFDMDVIDAALNEPELSEVWVSSLLYDELVKEDDEQPDGGYIVLRELPGRVMVLVYNRANANMRVLAFDQLGSEFAHTLIENPELLTGKPSVPHRA